MINRRKIVFALVLSLVWSLGNIIHAQDLTGISLGEDGSIPVWWIDGPYNQPIQGFGQPDDEAVINETNPSTSEWTIQHTNENEFLDLNNSLGWKLIPNQPEKVWDIKAGYAYSEIISDQKQEVELLFGGNTVSKVMFNGNEVYTSLNQVNAKKDQFSVPLELKQGKNTFLFKIINSNKNYTLAWFIPLEYEWGFYARLQAKNNGTISDLKIPFTQDNGKESINVISQFFFKKEGSQLKQRFDLEYYSPLQEEKLFNITVDVNNEQYDFNSQKIKPGYNRIQMYLPEVKEELNAVILLTSTEHNFSKKVTLTPRKKYELHLMPLSHTDIGYTHPQPIVKERHVNTLDDVIALLDTNKSFTWTIETTWQADEFRKARPEKDFNKLMSYIKEGRVSLSPLYTNPFTGWISKAEMERSFDKANQYKDEYGIDFSAAVYNDVPGEVWYLPKSLRENGVKFLVNGINEVYDNYKIQKALPKVFRWKGVDDSEVVLYLSESYDEGMRYGLCRNSYVTQYRIWERLTRLEERGYDYGLVLLDMVLTDNAGIPYDQLDNARKWNEEYAYPKFEFSNADKFAKEFIEKNYNKLPVIKGDFTSTWDLQYQGETARMLKYRKTQQDLPTAEKLASINFLLDDKQIPMIDEFEKVYDNMLLYSGHGSGLEYGFGSKADNIITDDYRENYVENARLGLYNIMSSSMRRMTIPKESFDSFGVIVFNPLSWERSDIVTLEFKQGNTTQYAIKDLSNGKIVKSTFRNNTLTFVAEKIPSVGYKQYEIIAQASNKTTFSNNGVIENEKFKLQFNENDRSLNSIVVKDTEINILQDIHGIAFGELYEKYFDEDKFRSSETGNREVEVQKDEFSEILKIKYNEGFVDEVRYELVSGLDYINYEVTIDLSKVPETEKTTEYGIAFPIKTGNTGYNYDILGGFIKASDRLPGTSKNMFAVRRGVQSELGDKSILLTSQDCRIFRVEYKDGLPYLIANIVNNFQENWNRNERNEDVVKFRFRIYLSDNDDLVVEKLLDESITPLVPRKSWYTRKNISESFFSIDNPLVTISGIRPLDNRTISLKVLNHSESTQQVRISSKLFEEKNIFLNEISGETKIESTQDNNIELSIKGNSEKEILITY